MRVKEAYDRLEQLKKLANNTRLLNQYFLNKSDLDEEIAEATGMNTYVKNTLREVLDEISTMATKYEKAIMEAEIRELNIR